jgi:DNA primase
MKNLYASMSLADDVKRAVRICDVAAQYGEVRRSGRLHVCRCLCGQNTDRHPSFTLYENESTTLGDHFHCFACQRHGSVIDLVMLTEHLDFKAALYFVRDRYLHGRDTGSKPVTRPAPRISADAPLRDDVWQLLEAATTHYQQALHHQPTARHYLRERGVSDDTATQLRLGYADGGLSRALHEVGHNLSLAARIGLIIPKGELLRERIVFPVLDATAHPIWLIGRALSDRQQPKYLGLPDGLVRKQPMQLGTAKRGVIIVEGPIDVAALVQWQLHHDFMLLALLGTAHTKAVDMLVQQHPDAPIFIATDRDNAGQAAALKLASPLIERGLPATILSWTGAKDCGALLQHGAEGERVFRHALTEAMTHNP